MTKKTGLTCTLLLSLLCVGLAQADLSSGTVKGQTSDIGALPQSRNLNVALPHYCSGTPVPTSGTYLDDGTACCGQGAVGSSQPGFCQTCSGSNPSQGTPGQWAIQTLTGSTLVGQCCGGSGVFLPAGVPAALPEGSSIGNVLPTACSCSSDGITTGSWSNGGGGACCGSGTNGTNGVCPPYCSGGVWLNSGGACCGSGVGAQNGPCPPPSCTNTCVGGAAPSAYPACQCPPPAPSTCSNTCPGGASPSAFPACACPPPAPPPCQNYWNFSTADVPDDCNNYICGGPGGPYYTCSQQPLGCCDSMSP